MENFIFCAVILSLMNLFIKGLSIYDIHKKWSIFLNQNENHQWGNSEAYLGPGWTSTMELFCENS